MTDNEIIKALECCCEAELNEDCEKMKCPLFDNEMCNCMNMGDENALYRYALDLINRQQAENKELKTENLILSQKRFNIFERIEFTDKLKKQTKAEAIKEFVERLKESNHGTLSYCTGWVDFDDIDNLVKEMVGK
jgi:hypothetical protein